MRDLTEEFIKTYKDSILNERIVKEILEKDYYFPIMSLVDKLYNYVDVSKEALIIFFNSYNMKNSEYKDYENLLDTHLTC